MRALMLLDFFDSYKLMPKAKAKLNIKNVAIAMPGSIN